MAKNEDLNCAFSVPRRSSPKRKGSPDRGSFCRLLWKNDRPPHSEGSLFEGVTHFLTKGGKKTLLSPATQSVRQGKSFGQPRQTGAGLKRVLHAWMHDLPSLGFQILATEGQQKRAKTWSSAIYKVSLAQLSPVARGKKGTLFFGWLERKFVPHIRKQRWRETAAHEFTGWWIQISHLRGSPSRGSHNGNPGFINSWLIHWGVVPSYWGFTTFQTKT